MEFEPPSFSLGLDETQVPSFSLGLDDLFSATPAAGVSVRTADGSARAAARSSVAANESSFRVDDDDGVDLVESTPKRSLKRLRRGPSKSFSYEKTCSPSTRSVITDPSCPDDIEEFSSEEEQPNRSQSQSYNPRSFSALKPVRTPPVFERKGANEESLPSALHSRVTSKKTSLGSKEVKFQGVVNTYASPPSTFSTAGVAGKASSSSGAGKAKTPLYEFRDNRICIDLDEEYEEPGSSFPSTDTQTAQLRRERFPHFLSVDDLERGDGGDPVYIDYRGQFGRNSAVRTKFSGPAGSGDFDALQTQPRSQPQARSKTARGSKRKNRNSNTRVLQENTSTGTTGTTGRKGYWLTSGGSKVYVTAEGQRLMGKEGYKRYMKENGKSGKPRKAGRKQQTSRKKN